MEFATQQLLDSFAKSAFVTEFCMGFAAFKVAARRSAEPILNDDILQHICDLQRARYHAALNAPHTVDSYNNKIYRDQDGGLHRDCDLPAIVSANNYAIWCSHGKIDRPYSRDGKPLPAVIVMTVCRPNNILTHDIADGIDNTADDPILNRSVITIPQDMSWSRCAAWYSNGVVHSPPNDAPAIMICGSIMRDNDMPIFCKIGRDTGQKNIWYINGKRGRDGDKPIVVTNTYKLYDESTRDAGDMRPIQVAPGKFARWPLSMHQTHPFIVTANAECIWYMDPRNRRYIVADYSKYQFVHHDGRVKYIVTKGRLYLAENNQYYTLISETPELMTFMKDHQYIVLKNEPLYRFDPTEAIAAMLADRATTAV